MNKLDLPVFAVSALLSMGAAVACEYPSESPAVPDGSTASREEMLAGQKDVNGYIDELKAYQQCLEEEEAAARAELEDPQPEELKRRDDLLTKKFNAAHDEMLKVAAAFNDELKEYQSRDE